MQGVVKSRWIVIVPLVTVVLLSLLVTQFSPDTIGPAGILLVFVLLYVFFASILFIILHAGEKLLRKIVGDERAARMPKWGLEVKRAYYVASILAFVPVALLAMQSLGQLAVQDLLLLTALTVLVTFYVLRVSR